MKDVHANSQPTIKPNNNSRDRIGGRNLSSRARPTVSWSEVTNQVLRDAIVSVCDAGAAIMLGVTTDKGAYSITVLDGNEKIREWPHTVDELEATLRWLVSVYGNS